jgi:hypothetical protein
MALTQITGTGIGSVDSLTPTKIQLGGSGDANALDDYEEGTFTVTDASGAGLTLTQNTTATYVKVGRLVFVSFYVTYPSTTDGSISLLGGFPFASTNLYGYLVGRTLSHGQDDMVYQLNGTTVTARLHYNNATRTNAQLSNAYILLSGSYIADA